MKTTTGVGRGVRDLPEYLRRYAENLEGAGVRVRVPNAGPEYEVGPALAEELPGEPMSSIVIRQRREI